MAARESHEMAVDARDVDFEEKLDKNVLAALPAGGKVVSVEPSGESLFCDTFRVDVELPDGETQSFFQKESMGQRGLNLMQSSFLSDSTIRAFIPEYVPKPLVIGHHDADPDRHFYLAEFVDLFEGQPGPNEYSEALVQLHKRAMGKSPEGKYGFGFNTIFGDLPQKNDWNSSWEAFFTDIMTEYFKREEEVRGPHDEEFLANKEILLSRVFPRYLRPLETGGNSIQPCLVHADLWPGNIKFGMDKEFRRIPYIYDSCCFWGHNEIDIAIFRSKRYILGAPYVDAYHRHISPSQPVADKEKRAHVYLLRKQVLVSTIYPNLRYIFVETVRDLVQDLLKEENEMAILNNQSLPTVEGAGRVASEEQTASKEESPVAVLANSLKSVSLGEQSKAAAEPPEIS